MDRINNAYALGGPTLLIQTVEKLTDIRVDHLAVIDFAGFQSMVDAVGGIDITMSRPRRAPARRSAPKGPTTWMATPR